MRTHRYPRKPIPRQARIRVRGAAKFGDYRQKVKYANGLWSRIIKAKEPSGICPCCRSRRWVDAAHGFIKGRYAHLRFDLSNGIPLCRACHRRVDSDHNEKRELWVRYVGPLEFSRLELLANSRGSKLDMAAVILSLEVVVESLRAGGGK